MSIMKKILFNNDKNIKKQSIIWNLIASLLNAILSAYMLMIVIRFIGIREGGIFAIASTLAYQLLIIGNYGMRNFQATDVNDNYNFHEYLYSRYITSFLMLLGTILLIIYNHYDISKSFIILSFILFKWIDAIEDVYHGFYQKHNRLDVGCREQSYRYIASLVVFTVVTIITKDLFISCMITFIFSLIFFIVLNSYIKKFFMFDKCKKINKKRLCILLYECFPLFISSYLYLYICNAPKYAIDSVLNDNIQSYFGILFMPVFVINLISTLIYRPIITNMAEQWNNNKMSGFLKRVLKQISVIISLTIFAVVFAYFLGAKVLGTIYGMNIDKYKLELCLLMIGGGFNAFVSYMLTIITIIRKQKKVIFGYIGVSILSLLLSNVMVKNYSILGASLLYLVLTIGLGFYFVIIFIIEYKKLKV